MTSRSDPQQEFRIVNAPNPQLISVLTEPQILLNRSELMNYIPILIYNFHSTSIMVKDG